MLRLANQRRLLGIFGRKLVCKNSKRSKSDVHVPILPISLHMDRALFPFVDRFGLKLLIPSISLRDLKNIDYRRALEASLMMGVRVNILFMEGANRASKTVSVNLRSITQSVMVRNAKYKLSLRIIHLQESSGKVAKTVRSQVKDITRKMSKTTDKYKIHLGQYIQNTYINLVNIQKKFKF